MRPETGLYWNQPAVTAHFEQLPPPSYLLAMLATHKPRTPRAIGLDAGCGAGRNLQPIADAGYQPVGIDLHRQMLAAALRTCPTATIHQADVTAIPLNDRSCEVVVCHGVLHNLPSAADIEVAVAELARVMTFDAQLSLNLFTNEHIDACLRATSDPERFTLPNGQGMTLLGPRRIEAVAALAGMVPLTDPVTYLSDGDPGQRSVWRAILVHRPAQPSDEASC